MSLASLALLSCGEPPGAQQEQLRLGEILGGGNPEGFARALTPRAFRFPEDHGPHPGFRNEWWYFTGNLETEEGRAFGYQLTFFTAALRPPDQPEQGWVSDTLWMAHAALTDVDDAVHLAEERFSRGSPGLAGANLDPFTLWLENWQVHTLNGNHFPWRLRARAEGFALDLVLSPRKPPVLQGEAGLSQKSPEPGNASYYYSMTRLDTEGSVEIGGVLYEVRGQSWLDREWSTSALAEDQSGWDWFSLQLDDGRDLMYYQLRTLEGETHPSSRGSLVDVAGQHLDLFPDMVTLTPLREWDSPTGISYTTAWRLRVGEESWRVEAVLEDQWMNLSVPYWEGAVRVFRERDGRPLGHGYLEMVR